MTAVSIRPSFGQSKAQDGHALPPTSLVSLSITASESPMRSLLGMIELPPKATTNRTLMPMALS